MDQALWKRFSKSVRRSFAVGNYVQCYTCATVSHIDKMDCGHFIPREFLGTKWSLINNKPQCRTCNRTKGGNLKVYERELKKEYGDSIIEELKRQSKEPEPSREEIIELINKIEDS